MTENTTPTNTEASGPDLMNMSGAEAKAYVDKQKEANADPKSSKMDTKYFANDPKTETSGNPVSEAAQEALRKFKVKVDGQELEVDEKELLRGYSHQRAANKILQEGKLMRKQAEEFVNMLKNKDSLFDVIKKMGHDPRNLAEEYLVNQLKDEMLDPKERELKEAKEKLRYMEEMEKQKLNEVEERNKAILTQKFAKEYNEQFISALEETGLPKSKHTIKEMARYVQEATRIGYKMSAQEAAKLVKEDLLTRNQSLIKDADGDSLIQLLGEDVANKIRKWDTSRLSNPERNLRTPENQGEHKSRERKSGKRMSQREWREFNRKP